MWAGTHYVALQLLTLPPENWDFRYGLLCLASRRHWEPYDAESAWLFFSFGLKKMTGQWCQKEVK